MKMEPLILERFKSHRPLKSAVKYVLGTFTAFLGKSQTEILQH